MAHYIPKFPSPLYSNHEKESSSQKTTSNEPVRTLFIRGLPSDVKYREVYNLFRPYEGFINASISFPGEQKVVSKKKNKINS